MIRGDSVSAPHRALPVVDVGSRGDHPAGSEQEWGATKHMQPDTVSLVI
jgi:hypothetical protein